jgi:hypothetical protein
MLNGTYYKCVAAITRGVGITGGFELELLLVGWSWSYNM